MSRFVQVDRELADLLLPALAQARTESLGVVCVSGYRSNEEQEALYTRYLARKKAYDAWLQAGQPDPPMRPPLPAAPPGFSFHNYALALDYAAVSLAARQRFGIICERAGLRWGGCGEVVDHFDNDPIHVDLATRYTIAQARRIGFPKQLVWINAAGAIYPGDMPLIDGAPRATGGR